MGFWIDDNFFHIGHPLFQDSRSYDLHKINNIFGITRIYYFLIRSAIVINLEHHAIFRNSSIHTFFIYAGI